MFDNPGRELNKLQQKLLEEDEAVYEDPEEALYEMKELLEGGDWDGESREPLYRRYSRDTEPEAAPVVEVPAASEPKKKRGIGGLVLAVILETLALLAVFVWWLLW